MKRLTWRDKAIRSIANALLEYEAQSLLMGESIEGKSAKKWISKERYPFGLREYTPYRNTSRLSQKSSKLVLIRG